MRVTKRLAQLICLAGITATALSGCGSDATPTATAAPTAVPTGAVTAAPTAVATDLAGQPCPAFSPQSGPDNFNDTVTLAPLGPDGLQVGEFKVGCGSSPTTGKTVTVQYTGWLSDGTKFDSSRDHGRSFPFVIGQGAVIKGWDEGVATMKVGGKRRLVIPAAIGYGASGSPPTIPANATLIFDVELLAIS